jgi:plasmid stabilization system protein ParE
MRLRLSRAALRDLKEAVEYVAADNLDAAERLRERLLAAADRLCRFPFLGPVEDGEHRVFTVPGTRFRLLYQMKPGEIAILRIVHGARQWPPARD